MPNPTARPALPVALAAALAALAGCDAPSPSPDASAETPDAGALADAGGGTDAGGDAAAGEDAGPPVGDVTYYGDVRPILAEHCVGCHAAGGIAPFALDTYEAAQPVATLITNATAERRMPPYLVDNSGRCQTYSEARWLDDRELEVLRAWDEAGEPMGDPATPDPMVTPPTVLDGSVSTIATLPAGETYAPDTRRPDDYRCFVVEVPADVAQYATGYHVHPGNPAVVHHVIVYAPADAAAASQIRGLDAAEAGPGYTCFGAAGADAFPVVLWAPGGGATNFPSGTGVALDPTLPLVIQVHYNTTGGGGGDRTTVDLESTPSATRARIAPLVAGDLSLAPRMAHVEASNTLDLSTLTRGFTIPITLYGAFPHMHTLGRTLRVDRLSASGEECLVDVPRWDFNWQLAYFYETPIRITSADSVRITCGFDTTSRTDVVTWGEGTQDEMCLNFFYMVIASGL